MGCRAQIAPSVIRGVSVDMIDFLGRPVSSHPQIGEPMLGISDVEYADGPRCIFGNSAGSFSSLTAVPYPIHAFESRPNRPFFPNENAGCRVVIDDCAQKVCGDIIAVGHWVLSCKSGGSEVAA